MKKIISLLIVACILMVGMPQNLLQANTSEQSMGTGGITPFILNEITVSTPEDLKTAMESASEDTLILLDTSFPTVLPAVITVNVSHSYNVTVDGQGIELFATGSAKHFNITSTGAGIISFTNIHFIGNSTIGGDGRPTQGGAFNGGGVNVTNSAANATGAYHFNNVEFKLISGGALRVGYATRITIDNATFDSNSVSGYNGGAIGADSSPKEFILRNSTLKNNIANWQGYDGGALIVTNVQENLEISNTTFIDNANLAHRGGAIALKFQGTTSAQAKVRITDSYFSGNIAQNYGGAKSMADGGAISVFDLPAGTDFLISGTTFSNNKATDDGGALLLQGVKDAIFNIKNSTFYENLAFGEGGDIGRSGGAIQAFANGAAMGNITYYNFTNNTFTKNTAKTFSATYVQQGGAISGSGGALRTARATFTNNILIGNEVLDVAGVPITTSRYRNVSMTTTAANNAGNYGLDNNAVITTTVEDIFGKYPVPLGEDYSTIKAGNPYTGSTLIVPSLPIIPNDGVVGLANKGGVSNGATTFDARGITRDTVTPDSGAVEIDWVKYDANGGTFTAPEMTVYTGQEYYVSENPTSIYDIHYDTQVTAIKSASNVSKQDRTFVEWNTAANGSGIAYTPGEVLTQAENLTLYAIWAKIAQYEVTYVANGATSGAVPVDPTLYAEDDVATVKTANTLEKLGYSFVGWNTAANGTGIDYLPASGLTITGDITLYAKWTPNPTYTLLYNGNGHTSGTVPVDSTDYQVSESAIVQAKGTLEKTGYTFVGWNTAADGNGIDYQPTSSLIITGSTTLYAKWSLDPPVPVYTLTYDGNGHTSGVAPIEPTEYLLNEVATVQTEGTLEKTGYTFVGWNTAADGNGIDYLPASSLIITGSTTLYAKWSENPPILVYTVTYNGNGHTTGTAPVDSTEYLENESAVIQAEGTLEKTGYTFSGWNTTADGMGTDYAVDAVVVMRGDITLYAKWSENPPVPVYTITYDGNGHTSGTAPIDPTEYRVDERAIVKDKGTLEKTGHTFVSWNTAADGSGTQYAPGSELLMTENVILYAKGVVTPPLLVFMLKYDGNGNTLGTAPVDPTDYTENVSAIVKEKGDLEKEGYTFVGWNTATDGTGTDYAPTAELIMIENVTLYAQWEKDEEGNESTTTPEEQNLPETGEQQHQIMMLSGALLFSFGIIILFKKRYIKE